MPSDDYYRRRYIWDLQLADLEEWDALGVLTDDGRKLLAGLRRQAAYFKERDMDDAVRRMSQEFDAFFPRGPELRATIEGEGVWRWLRARGNERVTGHFESLQLVHASLTSDGGTVEFVARRDSGEEIAVPTEALRDLLTAIQNLPDAARLLVGSEITLIFRPGT